MAEAWGGSFGVAWGVSFGQDGVTPEPPDPTIPTEGILQGQGGGGMPYMPADTERAARRVKDDRHLARSVEIAATGRVVTPELMLDDTEMQDEEDAIALLLVGLLQ